MANKRILLHACCGPCAIMPVLRLKEEGYEPVLWFMNPNIQPLSEYLRRREALCECAEKLEVELICEDDGWDMPGWLALQLPRVFSKERCVWCCQSRLDAAWQKALSLGIGAFSTSLLYSRYQPHEEIAEKGRELQSAGGPAFLYRDFRADWQKGIELSKDWGIYRQAYCGCVFSEAERYAKKFERVKNSSGK